MKKRVAEKFWFPWWPDKWIFGSVRIECTPAERGIWVDLLSLASKDDGYIRANEETPYPLQQLSGMLIIPEDELKKAIHKFIQTKKLTRYNNDILYVTKWDKYQFTDRHKRRVMSAQKDTMTEDEDAILENSIKEKSIEDYNKEALSSKVKINAEQEMQIAELLKKVKGIGEIKIGGIILYIRELSIEFKHLDYVEVMKDKCAWWLDHPLKKGSNIHLQLRNWFRIAAGRSSYQQGEARVGAKGKEIKRKTPDDFPDHDTVFVHASHVIARTEYKYIWEGSPVKFANDAVKYWEKIKENFKQLGETAEAFVKLIAIEWDSNNKKEGK